MNGSHTPGPWKAHQNSCYFEIVSEADGQIGDACASKFINGDTDKGEANAQLMAAAPELLEAAEETIEVLKGLANSHHFQMVSQGNKHHAENFSDCQASTCKTAFEKIKKTEAAIAKARGEL